MNDAGPGHGNDLRTRTKQFAIRIIRLYESLPKRTVAQTLGRQVLRSGTSVGAHYHEGCRGRSDADVMSKWETALQELDESTYWIELLIDASFVKRDLLEPLLREATELIAMLTASVKTIKQRTHK